MPTFPFPVFGLLACQERLARLLHRAKERGFLSHQGRLDVLVVPSEIMAAQLRGSRRSSKNVQLLFSQAMVEGLSDDELFSVLGHELGHLHHGHLWNQRRRATGLSWALAALFGSLVCVSALWLGLPMHEAGLASGVLSLILLFLVRPWSLQWVMGLHEFQADQYAASVAGVRPAVAALRKASLNSTNPSQGARAWWGSRGGSPSASVRIGRLYRTRRRHGLLARQ